MKLLKIIQILDGHYMLSKIPIKLLLKFLMDNIEEKLLEDI
jgi:hypothetical protein